MGRYAAAGLQGIGFIEELALRGQGHALRGREAEVLHPQDFPARRRSLERGYAEVYPGTRAARSLIASRPANATDIQQPIRLDFERASGMIVRNHAAEFLPESQIRQLVDMLSNLVSLSDISPLLACLAPSEVIS